MFCGVGCVSVVCGGWGGVVQCGVVFMVYIYMYVYVSTCI